MESTLEPAGFSHAEFQHQVLSGHSIVFFVRKATNPEESFITAEYDVDRRCLRQYYYALNKPVADTDNIAFGESIAKKLTKGIASGKIEIPNE